MRISDWSSDVCSSDLELIEREPPHADRRFVHLAHARRDRRALELYQRAAIIGAHQDPRLGKRLVDRVHLTGIERSEEHTSELQSLMRISYAVFCLKKTTKHNTISKNKNTRNDKT